MVRYLLPASLGRQVRRSVSVSVRWIGRVLLTPVVHMVVPGSLMSLFSSLLRRTSHKRVTMVVRGRWSRGADPDTGGNSLQLARVMFRKKLVHQ